jgi:hypothetical protein
MGMFLSDSEVVTRQIRPLGAQYHVSPSLQRPRKEQKDDQWASGGLEEAWLETGS